MSKEILLEDLKKFVKKHALSESSFAYHDSFHEINFTKEGESLIAKMFLDGKPMNCIPGCTIRICVECGTVEVSVYHDDVRIGGFRKIGTAMDTTYNLNAPMQLQMGSF